jgi:hypothetical protein
VFLGEVDTTDDAKYEVMVSLDTSEEESAEEGVPVDLVDGVAEIADVMVSLDTSEEESAEEDVPVEVADGVAEIVDVAVDIPFKTVALPIPPCCTTKLVPLICTF